MKLYHKGPCGRWSQQLLSPSFAQLFSLWNAFCLSSEPPKLRPSDKMGPLCSTIIIMVQVPPGLAAWRYLTHTFLSPLLGTESPTARITWAPSGFFSDFLEAGAPTQKQKRN